MNSRFNNVRSVLIIGLGGGVGQLAAVLCAPLLSRAYAPEAYGQWALLMSAVVTLVCLSSLRYELAVPLPAEMQDGANLFGLCVLMTAGGSLLIGGILAAAHFYLPEDSRLRESVPWIWSLPLMVAAGGVHQAANAWYTRTGTFVRMSVLTALLPLITVLIQLGIPWWGGHADARSLIAGSLVAYLIVGLASLLLAAHRNHLRFGDISFRQMTALARRYGNYPKYMTPYTLTSELRNRLVIFLLGGVGQAVAVGHLFFADRMQRTSVTAVSNAIRPVFFRNATVHCLHDLQGPLLLSLSLINRLSTPWVVLLWFEHAWIYEFLFGSDWRGASVFGAILSVPFFVLLHTNWLDRAFDVLGQQRLAFVLESVFSAVSVAALGVGLFGFRSVLWGVAAQSAVFAVYNVVWLWAFFKLARYDCRSLSHFAVRAVTLAGLWAMGYLVIDAILPSPLTIGFYVVCATFSAAANLRTELAGLFRRETPPRNTVPASVESVIA